MGYSLGQNYAGRDIGYGVPALCDAPGCNVEIDRGMDWQCDRTTISCAHFFCSKHRHTHSCREFNRGKLTPKPDIPKWVWWKMTAPSWQKYRDELPAPEFKSMQAIADAFKPDGEMLAALEGDS